jgi:hypothetical protein
MNSASRTIRKFDTGGTRDTDEGKLDYEGFLSPLVLQAYARYLQKHRVQSDGQLRTSDNWQKLFGDKHTDVCMKSLMRHVIDLWTIHRGFKPRIEKGEVVMIEDTLSAIIFNASAYLFKLEKDKQ